MKTYGDLNLKKLRQDNGLDFAHYTFKRGQCSCCYGPLDMADRYWETGRKPQRIPAGKAGNTQIWKYDRPMEDVQYILFKNAANGTGPVTKNDVICVPSEIRRKFTFYPYLTVCIAWQFPWEKMDGVLNSLREQLDDDYVVIRPSDEQHCIEIKLKKSMY